jgi:predicted O-linked N-acetylglucosamine transferase (SPINDLY family)
MLDREWGALGAVVAADGISLPALSVEDFADRLHASLQGVSWDVQALNDLGNRLFHAGACAHAAVCYEVVAQDAKALGARANLGRCDIRLGRPEHAESRARALIAEHPQRVMGWQLLGEALAAQHKLLEAKLAAERAVELSAGDATLAREWARLAVLTKDTEAAVKGFRLAWQQQPDDFSSLGQLVFYLRCLCEWQDLDALSKRLLHALDQEQARLPPFDLLAEPATAAQQAVCARRQAEYIQRLAARQPLDHVSFVSAQASGRLKVGFVSHGFGRHPTSILTSALFEQWRDSKLEVHLFSTRDDGNDTPRERLKAAVHTFYELPGVSQRDIAARIQAEGIDVLVDLDGYSRVRLPEVFAYRPAPVQVSWLAYPGTTGADYMDYVIADRFVLPPSLQPHFSEKVVYLPRCYQSSDPTRVIGEPPSREACGLPATGVVYACFNVSFKLNPRSIKRMLQVLAAVPGSVLWLLAPAGRAEERLRRQAQDMGVAASRLVFMKKLSHRAYLARYRHVDLFLDTEDYNAHTVASDALWAGCPVLTRPGETFASRVAGSLNHHLGMPEMNVPDDAAFVMKAVRYGRNAAYRSAIKAKLVRQRLASSLFDIEGFARDFEHVLLRMAAHRRAGGLPGDFDSDW